MDFPALLHFAQEGGVVLATCHKQKATGFAVEPTDEGEKFLGIVVPQPVDQGEGAVGSGGVDQPAGGFIDDEEGGVLEDDGGFHDQNFEERHETSKGRRFGLR